MVLEGLNCIYMYVNSFSRLYGYNVKKCTFWHVSFWRVFSEDSNPPVHCQSEQSSLSAWRNFASLAIQNAASEDSDQTANAQGDLNLRWALMSECMFSDVVAHIFYNKRFVIAFRQYWNAECVMKYFVARVTKFHDFWSVVIQYVTIAFHACQCMDVSYYVHLTDNQQILVNILGKSSSWPLAFLARLYEVQGELL